eukprot:g6509.t1
MATTCRRLYLRGDVELLPLRVGWDAPMSREEERKPPRKPSIDLTNVDAHLTAEDVQRVRRYTGGAATNSSILSEELDGNFSAAVSRVGPERLFSSPRGGGGGGAGFGDGEERASDRGGGGGSKPASSSTDQTPGSGGGRYGTSGPYTTTNKLQQPAVFPSSRAEGGFEVEEGDRVSPRALGNQSASGNINPRANPNEQAGGSSSSTTTTRGQNIKTTSSSTSRSDVSLQNLYGNASNYLELTRPPDSPKKQSQDRKLAQDYESLLSAHKRAQKYGRALERIGHLEREEDAAEELAAKEVQIQDLRLANHELRKRLRKAAVSKLEIFFDGNAGEGANPAGNRGANGELGGGVPDVSRSPWTLFDEMEREISALKTELRTLHERNTRLAVELERYDNPAGYAALASSTPASREGSQMKMPRFIRELQRELATFKKREDEFSRSERSNKLIAKCVQDLTSKLGKAEAALKETAKRADLTEKKADASEEFLEKILKKARDTESELEIARKTTEGLEVEVAGLKEACFHHSQFKRQENLLTKFLPLSATLGKTSGSAAPAAASASSRDSLDRKQLFENFQRLHKEILNNPELRCVIPLSARVKSGLDGLIRQHASLEEQASCALLVMQKSAADEIRRAGNSAGLLPLRLLAPASNLAAALASLWLLSVQEQLGAHAAQQSRNLGSRRRSLEDKAVLQSTEPATRTDRPEPLDQHVAGPFLHRPRRSLFGEVETEPESVTVHAGAEDDGPSSFSGLSSTLGLFAAAREDGKPDGKTKKDDGKDDKRRDERHERQRKHTAAGIDGEEEEDPEEHERQQSSMHTVEPSPEQHGGWGSGERHESDTSTSRLQNSTRAVLTGLPKAGLERRRAILGFLHSHWPNADLTRGGRKPDGSWKDDAEWQSTYGPAPLEPGFIHPVVADDKPQSRVIQLQPARRLKVGARSILFPSGKHRAAGHLQGWSPAETYVAGKARERLGDQVGGLTGGFGPVAAGDVHSWRHGSAASFGFSSGNMRVGREHWSDAGLLAMLEELLGPVWGAPEKADDRTLGAKKRKRNAQNKKSPAKENDDHDHEGGGARAGGKNGGRKSKSENGGEGEGEGEESSIDGAGSGSGNSTVSAFAETYEKTQEGEEESAVIAGDEEKRAGPYGTAFKEEKAPNLFRLRGRNSETEDVHFDDDEEAENAAPEESFFASPSEKEKGNRGAQDGNSKGSSPASPPPSSGPASARPAASAPNETGPDHPNQTAASTSSEPPQTPPIRSNTSNQTMEEGRNNGTTTINLLHPDHADAAVVPHLRYESVSSGCGLPSGYRIEVEGSGLRQKVVLYNRDRTKLFSRPITHIQSWHDVVQLQYCCAGRFLVLSVREDLTSKLLAEKLAPVLAETQKMKGNVTPDAVERLRKNGEVVAREELSDSENAGYVTAELIPDRWMHFDLWSVHEFLRKTEAHDAARADPAVKSLRTADADPNARAMSEAVSFRKRLDAGRKRAERKTGRELLELVGEPKQCTVCIKLQLRAVTKWWHLHGNVRRKAVSGWADGFFDSIHGEASTARVLGHMLSQMMLSRKINNNSAAPSIQKSESFMEASGTLRRDGRREVGLSATPDPSGGVTPDVARQILALSLAANGGGRPNDGGSRAGSAFLQFLQGQGSDATGHAKMFEDGLDHVAAHAHFGAIAGGWSTYTYSQMPLWVLRRLSSGGFSDALEHLSERFISRTMGTSNASAAPAPSNDSTASDHTSLLRGPAVDVEDFMQGARFSADTESLHDRRQRLYEEALLENYYEDPDRRMQWEYVLWTPGNNTNNGKVDNGIKQSHRLFRHVEHGWVFTTYGNSWSPIVHLGETKVVNGSTLLLDETFKNTSRKREILFNEVNSVGMEMKMGGGLKKWKKKKIAKKMKKIAKTRGGTQDHDRGGGGDSSFLCGDPLARQQLVDKYGGRDLTQTASTEKNQTIFCEALRRVEKKKFRLHKMRQYNVSVDQTFLVLDRFGGEAVEELEAFLLSGSRVSKDIMLRQGAYELGSPDIANKTSPSSGEQVESEIGAAIGPRRAEPPAAADLGAGSRGNAQPETSATASSWTQLLSGGGQEGHKNETEKVVEPDTSTKKPADPPIKHAVATTPDTTSKNPPHAVQPQETTLSPRENCREVFPRYFLPRTVISGRTMHDEAEVPGLEHEDEAKRSSRHRQPVLVDGMSPQYRELTPLGTPMMVALGVTLRHVQFSGEWSQEAESPDRHRKRLGILQEFPQAESLPEEPMEENASHLGPNGELPVHADKDLHAERTNTLHTGAGGAAVAKNSSDLTPGSSAPPASDEQRAQQLVPVERSYNNGRQPRKLQAVNGPPRDPQVSLSGQTTSVPQSPSQTPAGERTATSSASISTTTTTTSSTRIVFVPPNFLTLHSQAVETGSQYLEHKQHNYSSDDVFDRSTKFTGAYMEDDWGSYAASYAPPDYSIMQDEVDEKENAANQSSTVGTPGQGREQDTTPLNKTLLNSSTSQNINAEKVKRQRGAKRKSDLLNEEKIKGDEKRRAEVSLVRRAERAFLSQTVTTLAFHCGASCLRSNHAQTTASALHESETPEDEKENDGRSEDGKQEANESPSTSATCFNRVGGYRFPPNAVSRVRHAVIHAVGARECEQLCLLLGPKNCFAFEVKPIERLRNVPTWSCSLLESKPKLVPGVQLESRVLEESEIRNTRGYLQRNEGSLVAMRCASRRQNGYAVASETASYSKRSFFVGEPLCNVMRTRELRNINFQDCRHMCTQAGDSCHGFAYKHAEFTRHYRDYELRVKQEFVSHDINDLSTKDVRKTERVPRRDGEELGPETSTWSYKSHTIRGVPSDVQAGGRSDPVTNWPYGLREVVGTTSRWERYDLPDAATSGQSFCLLLTAGSPSGISPYNLEAATNLQGAGNNVCLTLGPVMRNAMRKNAGGLWLKGRDPNCVSPRWSLRRSTLQNTDFTPSHYVKDDESGMIEKTLGIVLSEAFAGNNFAYGERDQALGSNGMAIGFVATAAIPLDLKNETDEAPAAALQGNFSKYAEFAIDVRIEPADAAPPGARMNSRRRSKTPSLKNGGRRGTNRTSSSAEEVVVDRQKKVRENEDNEDDDAGFERYGGAGQMMADGQDGKKGAEEVDSDFRLPDALNPLLLNLTSSRQWVNYTDATMPGQSFLLPLLEYEPNWVWTHKKGPKLKTPLALEDEEEDPINRKTRMREENWKRREEAEAWAAQLCAHACTLRQCSYYMLRQLLPNADHLATRINRALAGGWGTFAENYISGDDTWRSRPPRKEKNNKRTGQQSPDKAAVPSEVLRENFLYCSLWTDSKEKLKFDVDKELSRMPEADKLKKNGLQANWLDSTASVCVNPAVVSMDEFPHVLTQSPVEPLEGFYDGRRDDYQPADGIHMIGLNGYSSVSADPPGDVNLGTRFRATAQSQLPAYDFAGTQAVRDLLGRLKCEEVLKTPYSDESGGGASFAKQNTSEKGEQERLGRISPSMAPLDTGDKQMDGETDLSAKEKSDLETINTGPTWKNGTQLLERERDEDTESDTTGTMFPNDSRQMDRMRGQLVRVLDNDRVVISVPFNASGPFDQMPAMQVVVPIDWIALPPEVFNL